MRNVFYVFMISAVLSASACNKKHPEHGKSSSRTKNAPAAESYSRLPGEGKKCIMDEDHYFTYRFAGKPKIGMAILSVEIYGRDGKRNTSFGVMGRYGMPLMRGAHDTPDQDFKLNRKGVYLLPVNVVMPGEWQIDLTFVKHGKTVYSGAFKFDV